MTFIKVLTQCLEQSKWSIDLFFFFQAFTFVNLNDQDHFQFLFARDE